jgi:peptide/nickel transport system permease protein
VIRPLIPVTIELATLATLFSILLGVPAGVISAVRQDTTLDYALRVFSLAGLSMPSFWLGMVIILVLVTWLGWIPPLTYVSPAENFKIHLVQFLLPALAVGYRSSALLMRITRSAVLEVMREDYIRTARAKGQGERLVIWRHAFKNSLLPVVTVIGIEFAFLIGGLVVTETVFNLPGVARFLVQAILWRDYPIVQNLVMFIAVVVILSNLLVDMLYGVLDPRVRYGE